MSKKLIQNLYKELTESLTDRRFLREAGVKKKNVADLLKEENWKERIGEICAAGRVTCASVLACCEKTMERLSAEKPEEGWLLYSYHYIMVGLFPECMELDRRPEFQRAVLFYLAVLKLFLKYEEQITGREPKYSFRFLSAREAGESEYREEYLHFRECFEEQYVCELMRIGGEVTSFDALGHVSGVHNIAMHVARQLYAAGVPIDLGLTSAAAAAHDIGKYGCRAHEAGRIPYLHYYYTDQWLKKNDMPATAHIASNHSTWDLELENLPVESLVLIYADFRVKSSGRDENGKEQIAIFTLQEAFSVILNKLDNVDQAKENRYRHVYAKLADFEDYMVSLGVNVDLTKEELTPAEEKDAALLTVAESVDRLKYMAISHNIRLMNKLSGETSFGNVLEAARSEKNWKNSRAYINLFEEYFTYMTQRQKMMTLKFLYELLMHREGDIRRQAANLMGNIIVHFDEEYRKELPEDAVRASGEMTGLLLWERYLNMIVYPDHKVTDQHRRWIGYALKIAVESVLSRCKISERSAYLELLLSHYRRKDIPDSTVFTLIDTALIIPLDLLLECDLNFLIRFTEDALCRDSLEIRTAALRFLKYFTAKIEAQAPWDQAVERMACGPAAEENVSLRYLCACVSRNWELPGADRTDDDYRRIVYGNPEIVSDIFLENLKTGTPWVIKAVNIELLLEYIQKNRKTHVLHIATHFSNLLKVSERITVRHSAGQALVRIAPLMSRDQRNEVAIELMKGLETGEYEFSKYIPEYLGEFVLYLYPTELDEFINDLSRLLISANDRVVCVALDTLGVILQHYKVYRERFLRGEEEFCARRKKILGRLLSGLANYTPAINQEAFLVISQYLFAGGKLTLEDRMELFSVIYKKLVTLVPEQETGELSFFNSAASLNHIYRFIGDWLFTYGSFDIEEKEKVAFFPGTFDPFSLSHKEIAREIRDLGFTVYLALDEFSWSKKTQPRMIRRQIITMSVANEDDIYLFPDDIPVNIANPADLKRLRELFPDQELYIVVGSDVVSNASSYKKPPEPWSIHSLNHIIFLRDTMEGSGSAEGGEHLITGRVVRLKLPLQLEDISSTRIRENVDYNRDISNLIDPVAQNYIYENSLYLREPQYKPILQARAIHLSVEETNHRLSREILSAFAPDFEMLEAVRRELSRPGGRAAVLRDGHREDVIVGVLLFCQISTMELYGEFRNTNVVNYIREHTSGKMMLINGIFLFGKTEIDEDRSQLLLTEAIAACLQEDFTYCIYSSNILPPPTPLRELLRRQGFLQIPGGPAAETAGRGGSPVREEELPEDALRESGRTADGRSAADRGAASRTGADRAAAGRSAEVRSAEVRAAVDRSAGARSVAGRNAGSRSAAVRAAGAENGRPVYVVDMKSPVTVFKNIETAIKEPFNHSPRVLAVIDAAHRRLQESLTELYPGNLVLSVNASVMHHKLVKLITAANGVPEEPLPVRTLGKAMCVPFGKILRGVAVPNTVTKALHTEKTFDPSVESFRITEYPNYSPLENQIRTIKSFGRDVILVDDLLHKGYRIRELNPLFEQEGVNVDRIIVGILSGRGKDLMAIQNRKVESVYFLPNMRVWFVESTMYPFIGGDRVGRPEKMKANLLNSVNMILPYAIPTFLDGTSRRAIRRFSMTCLENARDILKALEEEYQECFERKLTLNRLSEVVISPSCPDRGNCLSYDYHLAASVYVENDIEMLGRLERMETDKMENLNE